MLLHPSGNRLAARFNPKLVEWGIIPAVLTIPFVLAWRPCAARRFAPFGLGLAPRLAWSARARAQALGRLLIGHRLRLRQLMLHAEFLHRNLMLGLHLVGVHLSLQRTPHRDKRRYSVQYSSRADRRPSDKPRRTLGFRASLRCCAVRAV